MISSGSICLNEFIIMINYVFVCLFFLVKRDVIDGVEGLS